jgi:peptidyl-prolyl cis-trans isomerase SurA
MNWKRITAAAVISAALTGAASPATAQTTQGVAAVVNDRPISTFDVRQRASMLISSAGIDSTPEMEERARTQALRDLIDEQLQIQEAANYEITVSSEDLQRRLEDIARQNNTDLAGLTRDLAANGISITTLRSQIEADIVWSRLIGGLYGRQDRITATARVVSMKPETGGGPGRSPEAQMVLKSIT